jgi:putative flippase GtrA
MIFDKPFIRFILIGSVNALFGYSIYAALIFLGVNFAIASFISTCLGVLFNFKTISKFVFQVNSYELFWKFLHVYGIVYVFGIIFLKLLNICGINYYFGGVIVLFLNALFAFILNKRYVFEK